VSVVFECRVYHGALKYELENLITFFRKVISIDEGRPLKLFFLNVEFLTKNLSTAIKHNGGPFAIVELFLKFKNSKICLL
jgi:hypothetical protein